MMKPPIKKTMSRNEATRFLQEADRIFIVCVGGYYQSGWGYVPKYKLLAMKNGALYDIHVPEVGYYSKRTQTYNMGVWGTDRRYELIYSITRSMDITDKLSEKTYYVLE